MGAKAILCPGCRTKLATARVPAKLRCPKCQMSFRVAGNGTTEAASTPAAGAVPPVKGVPAAGGKRRAGTLALWCWTVLGGLAVGVLVGLALLLGRPGTGQTARTVPVAGPQPPPSRDEARAAATRPPVGVPTRTPEEIAAETARQRAAEARRQREAEAAREQERAAEAARRKEEQARAARARALADYDAAMVSGDSAVRGQRFEEAVRYYTTALEILADAEPLLGQDADSASRITRATEALARAEKARALASRGAALAAGDSRALAAKNTALLGVAMGLSQPAAGDTGAVPGNGPSGVPAAPAPVEGITKLVTARIDTLEDTYLSPRGSLFSLLFQQASFSPDGRYLFTNAGKSPVKSQFWSVPDLQPVLEADGGRWAQPPPLYHPRMHTVATTVYQSESKTPSPETRLWSVRAHDRVCTSGGDSVGVVAEVVRLQEGAATPKT
jgi:hypothetical protein